MKRSMVGLVVCACVLLLGSSPGCAEEKGALPQYARSAWLVPDGLPENTVQALQQATDGSLWVGTTGGAVRFDGSHFAAAPANYGSIFALLVDRDGTLWLGTEGSGLLHLQAGRMQLISAADGLTDGFVRAILQDSTGRIWVGTDNGLFWMERGRAHLLDTSRFANPLSVHALMEDAQHRIWVGGSRLLVLHRPSPQQGGGYSIAQVALPGMDSQNRVKCILETRDGVVWVGTVGGLDRLVDGRFVRVPGVRGTVRTMLQTRDGVLWVGTIGQGLFVRRGAAFLRLSGEKSGWGNTVLALLEDDSHQVWVGTQDGLYRLHPTPLRIVLLPGDTAPDFATVSPDRGAAMWAVSSRVYHVEEGVAKPYVFPGLGRVPVRNVFRDQAATLWIGTDGSGVYHLTANGAVHYMAPVRLVNNFVRAFLETRDGAMWVGTDEGVSRIAGEQVTNYRMADGLAYFSTRSLLEDRNGDVWIGTERGLSKWRRGRFVQDEVTRGLADEKVWSILEDHAGTLWFGTRDHGLYRSGPEGLQHLTMKDGLVSDSIYQLLEDKRKQLWMSGPAGLASYPLATLETEGGVTHFNPTVYGFPDGAAGAQMYGGRQPSGCVGQAGTLWFPSNRGAVEVTPALPVKKMAPRVSISSVSADGRSMTAGSRKVVLPASFTRLEIAFAPVLLRPQEGLRFRYKLDGLETGWMEAGGSRSASYTALPPGQYRFHVAVYETDEPGTMEQASFDFRVLPHFYETWWFVTGCVLAVALLTWLGYVIRLRQVRSRFQAVLGERSRLAREMHDTVIQGCTSVSALLEAMSSLQMANQPVRADLLEHARVQVRTTIDEARQAVWNLRHQNLVCTDLPQRVARLTEQVRADFSVRIELRTEGRSVALDDAAAREMLMVIREALCNAALHGRPERILVQLQFGGDALGIQVTDDGAGFAVEHEMEDGLHYGIAGMRERVERLNGSFTLTSVAGVGTTVSARVRYGSLAPRRVGVLEAS